MNKNLYSKIAIDNIRKNKTTYLPYIFSSTVIIALFFMLQTIASQTSIEDFYGSGTMGQVLNFGVNIIVIFSAIFIFYTSNFLFKRRQSELGLYSVLGMDKKHINQVIFFENMYSGGASLLLGIIFGSIFSKLMFVILLNILGLDTSIKLSISFKSILVTGVVLLNICWSYFIYRF